MSDLMTCEATRSITSSLASEDGPAHFDSLDGLTTDLFGLVPVRANLSARQAKDLGLMTLDTSGRIGSGSSKSDALQRSLASKLQRRLTGSVSCEVTWKRWDTPWGQCLSKPRALVRSTFGIVIGLWPTMTSNAPARDGYNEAGNSAGQVAIRKIVLSLYPTATCSTGGGKFEFGECSRTGTRQQSGRDSARLVVDDPGFGWGEGWTEHEFRSRGFSAPVASIDGCQYVECPDGKWRRLPPPRVRWLGNGIPARVAKLRALGNAIDPRPAAAFIAAADEAMTTTHED